MAGAMVITSRDLLKVAIMHKNHNYIIFFVIVIGGIFGSTMAHAQVIRGRVSDSRTNEPLPAATVQIAGTYQGTITNAQGLYAIAVGELPVDLVVRYIGYRTDTLTVDALTVLEFKLEPVEFEMDQIVITDEDPAVWIMRQVIERKQQWQKKLQTFEAQAYSRGTFSNDTGIVAIQESVATAWWDYKLGLRQQITGIRYTGNLNFEDRAPPGAYSLVNLYSDNINVVGHNLIGVTHPNALDKYNFTLGGTRRVDDEIVYDIDVELKNSTTSGFLGSVSVLDGEFALIEVDLQPGPAFIFPVPFKNVEVSFQQQFSNYGGEIWVPVDLRRNYNFVLTLGPLLSLPPVGLDFVSRFTDYQLNVALPDSVFEGEGSVNIDSSSVASNDMFDRDGTIVPLTPKESIAYASIDSTNVLRDAFAPRGSLGRAINRMDQVEDQRSNALNLFSFATDLGISPVIWYNRVDAFHGGLEFDRQLNDAFKITAQVGLNTGQPDPKWITYKGSAQYEKDWFLDVAYHAENMPTYSSLIRNRLINSVTMLFGQNDYFDYYRREGIAVSAGYQFDWRSAKISGTFLNESHQSLSGEISYDFFMRDELQRLNPLIPEGDLRSVRVDFSFGGRSVLQVFAQRYFRSSVEITLPGSDFSFQRYSVSAGGRINTFLKRRLLKATLDFNLSAGLASDHGRQLPPQRAFILEGGISIFHGGGTLYTRRGLPYIGNSFALGNWEHNFRTLPFEKIGLRSLVNRNLNVIVFGGHAFIRGANPKNNDWVRHNELGVSVSGIGAVLRINLAYRMETRRVYPSLSVARIF